MNQKSSLLVELFVEELPPKALRPLSLAFAQTLVASLQKAVLVDPSAAVTPYATPRRLAVHIDQVLDQAAEQQVQQKLMPVSVGLNAEGQATPALLKKLESLGADASVVKQLSRRADGKNEMLYWEHTVPGATLATGLQAALQEAIAKLPIPKVMRYQLHHGTALPGWDSVQFVRPVHGLMALHGSEVVPVQALGLTAGRHTHGHRFEALQDPLDIPDANSYATILHEQGRVVASFDERRASIAAQLDAAAASAGLQVADDDALLDEVTALVEWPKVLTCQFDQDFLQVPPECLILTMKANQKYFPLQDGQGQLSHRFLVVSNIDPQDPSMVVAGNERVVRARLQDARFFFEQDQKQPLANRVDGLAKVVYLHELGTQAERSERVRAIARDVAKALGQTPLVEAADQAARLAKTDLLTDMVGEFPELQGTMGRYYALHDGLPTAVADAIEDHYKPRFSGDALPRGEVGTVVALADKLETLVGLFGVGKPPTGDRDPFALRRHALGVIRLLMEKRLPLDVPALLALAAQPFGALLPDAPASNAALQTFIHERLIGHLREQGASAQEAEAVTASGLRLGELPQALQALRAFGQLPEATALAAANKRIGNILKKTDTAPVSLNKTLLQEPAEQALHTAMAQIIPQANARFDEGDYTASLKTLAGLRQPVDAFFDTVMVNADDAALKANRLQLLHDLHGAMNRVADLAQLAS